jgi:hypothetical protein
MKKFGLINAVQNPTEWKYGGFSPFPPLSTSPVQRQL